MQFSPFKTFRLRLITTSTGLSRTNQVVRRRFTLVSFEIIFFVNKNGALFLLLLFKMARAGNDYMQRESRDGQLTTGLYQVLLPDGRYQVSFPFSYFEMVGSSFKVNKVPAGRLLVYHLRRHHLTPSPHS